MSDHPHSQRDLWRAVIRQALDDAVSGNKELVLERRRARAWFKGAGDDFCTVCALADHEPSQVRRLALDYIERADERAAADGTRPPLHRNAVVLEHDGMRLTLAEWATRTGLKQGTITYRLGLGWTASEALTTPLRRVLATAA